MNIIDHLVVTKGTPKNITIKNIRVYINNVKITIDIYNYNRLLYSRGYSKNRPFSCVDRHRVG